MKTAYVILISALMLVLALLFFPTLHFIFQSIDMASWLPLTAAGATILPYALFGFVVYIIFKIK